VNVKIANVSVAAMTVVVVTVNCFLSYYP